MHDTHRPRRVLTDTEWGCGPTLGLAIIIAVAGWYVCDVLKQLGF